MRPLLAIGALAGLLCACERQSLRDRQPRESGPLLVYAVNYPLLYFAERIGGDAVEVRLPAPAGVDPAHWWPAPETVAEFQAADLILLNGAGYARWVMLASLPRAKLVDTSGAFRDRLIVRAGSAGHVHGPEGLHSHGELASTTWLDPGLAALQAQAVARALAAARPGQASGFEARRVALEAELDVLDARLTRAAQRIGTAPLLFSHPVYAYLERAYGLHGRSVQWEPALVPAEAEWSSLDALLGEHPARWMIWEKEPLAQTRQLLRERDVEGVVFDPAGNRVEGDDWLAVMDRNVAAIERIAAAPAGGR